MDFKKIKKKSKALLKKHFFRSVIIAFISYLVLNGSYSYVTRYTNRSVRTKGEYVTKNIREINKNGKSNADVIYEIIINGKKDINDEKNKVKDETSVLANAVINKLTKTRSFALEFLNSVNKIIFKGKYETISIISFLILLYFAYVIFIKYPLTIGKTRYFIEKNKYEDTKCEKLFFTYRIKKSINCR